MKIKIDTLGSQKIYSGSTLQFFVDKIKINNIHAVREYVHYPEACGVIPVTDDNKIIMVRQYRYTNRYYSLEIPAGKKDQGESLRGCAKRELVEETGYIAKKITKLITYYPAISYSKEKLHIYLAEQLIQSKTRPDSDEFIKIEKLSLNKVLDLIRDNKIMDSKTILSLLLYKTLFLSK